MNKAIVLTLALAFATVLLLNNVQKDRTPSEMFEEWRNKYGLMLHLTSSELAYRVRIFEKNLKEIEAHNANSAHTYKQGVNQFTAYSQEEFEAMFLSKIEAHPSSAVTVEEPLKDGISIDWVAAGAVSPVKNQGSCTATYAFSAIGGIEGVSAIYFKQQTEYSVQQIIDCSGSYGNSGCNSGTMVNSYNYILTKGIQTELAYPYRGVLGACQAALGLFKIKGFVNVNKCTDLENALYVRPIPVAVDGQNFGRYTAGIFDSCGKSLSLAALLVGATDQYYRVKLSWGVTWGEAGYIRLSRTNNICGICDAATYPTV